MTYEIEPDASERVASRIERLHDTLATEYGRKNVEVWHSDDGHGCIVAKIDNGVGTPTYYRLKTNTISEFVLEVTTLSNPCETFDKQAGTITLSKEKDGPTMERKRWE